MQIRLALVLGLAATLASVSGCEKLKPIGSQGSASTVPAGDRVKLEMYIMSKCPFGVQAVQGLKPALDQIGNWVDFKIDYIGSEQGGKFSSMHGEPEAKGDMVQLCVMNAYPEQAKYMAFLDCWNKNWEAIPERWEACAEQNGMDKGKIKSCVDGNEGKELLGASFKRAQQANAQGSPTIKLAGADYNGGRTGSGFIRAICEKIPRNKPPVCAKLPEEPTVEAIVLTDKRCPQCQTAGLEAQLKSRFFPKLQVTTLDYSQEAGKKLMKELDIKLLPVILFKAGAEKAERYPQIERWMLPKGPYKQLRFPAKFDPTAEICDNKIDDTADGKIDCDDPTCQNSLICRKEIPKKLEVFVMSQCPYGVRALDAMKEVLENFKGKIAFDVHYIADKNGPTFNSLHGPAEVDENIRQLCVKKHFGQNYKWMEYIWCRNKAIQSPDWKSCAIAGISADVVEKCATGDEGKKLLEEDIKIAQGLEVSGSPTWLANNKFKFGGIAAEPIKTNLCQHNAGLPGCDKKLSEAAPAGGAPAGGACGS